MRMRFTLPAGVLQHGSMSPPWHPAFRCIYTEAERQGSNTCVGTGVLVASRTSFVPDLFTENACPGTKSGLARCRPPGGPTGEFSMQPPGLHIYTSWPCAAMRAHAADRAQPDALRFAGALALSAGGQWAEVATAGHLDARLEQHPRSVIALFSRF